MISLCLYPKPVLASSEWNSCSVVYFINKFLSPNSKIVSGNAHISHLLQFTGLTISGYNSGHIVFFLLPVSIFACYITLINWNACFSATFGEWWFTYKQSRPWDFESCRWVKENTIIWGLNLFFIKFGDLCPYKFFLKKIRNLSSKLGPEPLYV